MSVKKMLPLVGVGSAAALIGLVASRRAAASSAARDLAERRQRPSGIAPRARAEEPSSAPLPEGPLELPRDFWDVAPESAARGDEAPLTRSNREQREALDGDELTADWLARATEAPAFDAMTAEDVDDPAEIPADSLSMISDASRHAAALATYDDEPPSDR